MRVLKSSSFSFLTVAAIGLSGSGFVAAQMMDEGPDPAQVRIEYLAEEIRLASGRVAHLCGTRNPHSDSWVCGPRVGGGLIPRNDAPYYLRGEPWFADPTSRALYNENPGSDYGMDRSGHGPVAGTPNGNGMVGSVSQSSTVHDLDMQISVEAEYKYDRPGSESHPHLRDITQADPSWWSLSDARDDTGSARNPNAVGVNTHGYPGFETSDRIPPNGAIQGGCLLDGPGERSPELAVEHHPHESSPCHGESGQAQRQRLGSQHPHEAIVARRPGAESGPLLGHRADEDAGRNGS